MYASQTHCDIFSMPSLFFYIYSMFLMCVYVIYGNKMDNILETLYSITPTTPKTA